jgi:acetylornithine deacetylase
VARDCQFLWEFRALPGVPASYARDRLALFTLDLVARSFADFPLTGVETITEVEIPGLAPEPGSAAERLALRLAKANHTIAVPYGTEAGQFQKGGICTVVCGPGSIEQAHQPDEFIELGQFAACLDFLAALAVELSV